MTRANTKMIWLKVPEHQLIMRALFITGGDERLPAEERTQMRAMYDRIANSFGVALREELKKPA